MSSAPVWLQYATTAIALLAFGLSALSLYFQRRDKRPRLKLQKGLQIIQGNADRYVAKFSAGNLGDKTLHVVSARLEFPERLRNRLKVWSCRPKRKTVS